MECIKSGSRYCNSFAIGLILLSRISGLIAGKRGELPARVNPQLEAKEGMNARYGETLAKTRSRVVVTEWKETE